MELLLFKDRDSRKKEGEKKKSIVQYINHAISVGCHVSHVAEALRTYRILVLCGQ